MGVPELSTAMSTLSLVNRITRLTTEVEGNGEPEGGNRDRVGSPCGRRTPIGGDNSPGTAATAVSPPRRTGRAGTIENLCRRVTPKDHTIVGFQE